MEQLLMLGLFGGGIIMYLMVAIPANGWLPNAKALIKPKYNPHWVAMTEKEIWGRSFTVCNCLNCTVAELPGKPPKCRLCRSQVVGYSRHCQTCRKHMTNKSKKRAVVTDANIRSYQIRG